MLNLSPKIKTNFVHYMQFVWRRIIEDHCGQMASALTLTTLLALVPLLTIVFTVLGAMPAFREQAQEMIDYMLLHFLPTSAETVQVYLKQFTSKAAELTGVGGFILVITSLILIANIEEALNAIWRVPVARKGFAALVMYWAILTLVPILIVVIMALTSYISVVNTVSEAEYILGNVIKILPFISSVLAFTILYVAVPNVKVPLAHALVGGVTAGVLFEAGRLAFRFYITNFPNYQLLYGALATLPIMSLWIYLSWLFILLGAEVTHGLRYYDRKSLDKISHFLIVYRWLAFLWEAQHHDRGLTLMELLQKQPLSSMYEAEQILEHMEQQYWVRRTEQGDYVLAKDMHEFTLMDLYQSLNYPLPKIEELHLQRRKSLEAFPGDESLLEILIQWEKSLEKTAKLSLAQCYKYKS